LKRFFQDRFLDIAKQNPALTVDVDELSLAARTVEGTLLVDQFDKLRRSAEIQHIQIRIRTVGQVP
jgi:hypothetical protein